MLLTQGVMTGQPGLARWQAISQDPHYADLPPLQRLVHAVRDQSSSATELLDQAFELCEANLEISRMEYAKWRGLCVVDAVGVFSLQGLGGDLCLRYGYNFWEFLKAIAKLARQSRDSAQYHQCINHNLFSSPADDNLVLERMRALEKSSDIHCRGCMVDTGELLSSLAKRKLACEKVEESNNEGQITKQHLFAPYNKPELYRGYGRRLKLDMGGKVFVKGPFCLNVWLDQPFFWLVGIRIEGRNLWQHEVELQYEVKLDQKNASPVRLLIAADSDETAGPGRADRHFWVHDAELPHDAGSGVGVTINESNWRSMNGHPREAYGHKCKTEDLAMIKQRSVEIIMAIEASGVSATPNGQLTLPTLKSVAQKGGLE